MYKNNQREFKMTKLNFLEGMEFEQCYRNMLEAISNYPKEADPSERRALIDFVDLSYNRATELAGQYDAVDLLDEHTKTYRRFQELTDRIIQASIFHDQDNHRS